MPYYHIMIQQFYDVNAWNSHFTDRETEHLLSNLAQLPMAGEHCTWELSPGRLIPGVFHHQQDTKLQTHGASSHHFN